MNFSVLLSRTPGLGARALAAVLTMTALLGLGVSQVAHAPEAAAAARVSIAGPDGAANVAATGNTDITVRGSGFQSIQGGFGGIYVLFGWVSDPSGGSWKPSRGGRTGTDLLYVPDTEARDNAGYQRFTAFPGSSTSSAANGGTLAADGSWSLRMRTPGARFTAQDRSGNEKTVDCTQVQCGIITIGAHGVVNPANESFTPVSFTGEATADAVRVETNRGAAEANRAQAGAGSGGNAPGAEGPGGGGLAQNPQQQEVDALAQAQSSGVSGDPGSDGEGNGATAADSIAVGDLGVAGIGLQQETIQAGKTLGFTGQGFAPGEQVVVSMAGGSTGAGPLTAGQFGEVAGAVPLAADLLPGTHILRLTGAGSGQEAEIEFTVAADPLAAAGEDTGNSIWTWGLIAVLVMVGLILLLTGTSITQALLRRRRLRRAEANAEEDRGQAQPITAQALPAQADDSPTQQIHPVEEFIDAPLPPRRRRRATHLDTSGPLSSSEASTEEPQDTPAMGSR